MVKYKKSDVDLVSLLLAIQEHTSPIRLSIGWMKDGAIHSGIILHEAAPKVIETLIQKGYICDLIEEGMLVYKL